MQAEDIRIPQNMLIRRSPLLKEEERRQEGAWGGKNKKVEIIGLKRDTIIVFVEWSLMVMPELPEDLTMARGLELAGLADQYEFFGLKNQVSDLFRDRLAGGIWQLDVQTMTRCMETMRSGTWMRRLLLAAVWTVQLPGLGRESERRGWLELVGREGGDLGQAWAQCCLDKWDEKSLRSGGPCRFHDHRYLERFADDDGDYCSTTEVACPWLASEIYPEGETVARVEIRMDARKAGKTKGKSTG